MKHLSAFFRPVTNALSAWSVGLHSFFSHLLISAGSLPQRNVSVTSASAAIVGTPSRRRRGLMLKPLALMLLFLLASLNVWGTTITLSESDVRSNTSYNTSAKTFTNGVQFGYINVMTNNSNGTPTGWAKNQVMQSKSGSYLYNKVALSTIQHVKIYIVVNDNALSIGYGTTEKPTTNTIAKANATKGTQSVTYTSYANKTTKTGQTTTATTYDFDLSSYNATYFTIIPGGSTYIWKVEITYNESDPQQPANYYIPKFAVSIPSGTIGVRCSQHSLRLGILRPCLCFKLLTSFQRSLARF